ncbi:hypothetical protein [Frankia tisae]|uniref:hypothetical protein n=1 Tax=Frankia tisae TaxID=2950104 RepID=UPI0021BE12AE|nr:hypothetical protein [Frankia tisae]
MPTPAGTDVIDPARLRQVFGAYPTGAAAIAAVIDGAPVGLAASSTTWSSVMTR